jgi:hypothetical protein
MLIVIVLTSAFILLCLVLAIAYLVITRVTSGPTNANTTNTTAGVSKQSTAGPEYIRQCNAIAFTGGGTRAMTQATGIIMGLLRARKQSVDQLLTNVRVMSSNSGGSWFLGMLGYSRLFNSWLDQVSQGADPQDVFERNYIAKLRTLQTSTSSIAINLRKLQVFDKIASLMGSYSRFLGIPWKQAMEQFIFAPVPDIIGVSLSTQVNPITAGKTLVFMGSIMTDGTVGVTASNNILEKMYDSAHITYEMTSDCTGHCTASLPVVFGMNFGSGGQLPFFMGTIDNLKATYLGWTYMTRNSTTEVRIQVPIGIDLQTLHTTALPVTGASAVSSAAVALLGSERAINTILNRLWKNISPSSKWTQSMLGNVLSTAMRDLSVAIEFYPTATDPQHCYTDKDCGRSTLCMCTNRKLCPDAQYTGYYSSINKQCVAKFPFGCKCKTSGTPSMVDGIVGSRGEPSIAIANNQDTSSTNAARLQTRIMAADGGYLENTGIVANIRAFQMANDIKTPCVCFSLLTGISTKTIFIESGAQLMPADLSLLFGSSTGTIDFINNVDVAGLNILNNALYMASPGVFTSGTGIPAQMWPPTKDDWFTEGLSQFKLMLYKSLETVENNLYGIKAGTPLTLYALVAISPEGGAIPIPTLTAHYNAMAHTVRDSAAFVEKHHELFDFI